MAVEQLISPLMGVSFRPAETKQIVSELVVGEYLQLERDPANQYDANAIKVTKAVDEEPEFLGFVAKEVAIVLAPIMDANEFDWLTCTVSDMTNPKKPNLVIEWEYEDELVFDDSDGAEQE